MQTTLKEYNEKSEILRSLKNKRQNAKFEADYDLYHSLDVKVKELEKSYFDKLPTVNVQFYIGSRKYSEEVVKIGKAYFNNGTKMTQSRGYYNIIEIEEITEEMRKDMMADSYWY